MKNLISIVVPCFNEQEVLRQTYERLHAVDIPGCDKELVFVNDGSRDKTLDILKQIASEDDEVRVISFSRNFGHQPAVGRGKGRRRGYHRRRSAGPAGADSGYGRALAQGL